jgi:2-hydroxycyclohexanecarboxyl-CoA dehydrogenase
MTEVIMRLKDKIAIVTGGGQGIGKAIACCLSKEGAMVVVADKNEETAKNTAQEIVATGGKAIAIQVDVTKSKEVARVFQRVLSKYSKIDILVNNAGYNKLQPFVDNTEDFWDMMIAVNLKSAIICSRVVLDNMLDRKYGKIINISSDSGLIGSSGCVVYSAAKGGIISFTKALAREVAEYNIHVNCVAPGPTQTPLWDRFVREKPEILDDVRKATPQKRVGKPEDIASAILFLASDEAKWMVGQTLSVSGGFVMI